MARGDAEEIGNGLPGECDYQDGDETAASVNVWRSLLDLPIPSVMS